MSCRRFLTLNLSAVLLVCCLSAGSSLPAQEVLSWNLAKLQLHSQTENNVQPGMPFEYSFSGTVETDTPGFFDTVTLENAPGGTLFYSPFGGAPSAGWEFGISESDQATLDAAYPNQSYDIEATGPGGVDFTETVDLGFPGAGFPTEVPYFTGSTYSQLQNMAAGQEQVLSWNTPPADGFFLLLVDVATGSDVLSVSNIEFLEPDLPAVDTTGFTLPADTLAPDSDYLAVLIFANTNSDSGDPIGFPTGDGNVIFGNSTEVAFSTAAIPEPTAGALALAGCLAFFSVCRKRAARD